MFSILDVIIFLFFYFWLVNIYCILVFCWLNIVFIWLCYNFNYIGGGLGRRENFEIFIVVKYYYVRFILKVCNFKSIKVMDFKFGFFLYNCIVNNLVYIIKINGFDFFYGYYILISMFFKFFILLFLWNIIEFYCSSIYFFGNFNFLYWFCIFVELFLWFLNVLLRILKFKMMVF